MTNTRENIKHQRRGSDGKLLANTPSLKLLEAVNDAYQAIRQGDKDVPNAIFVLGASDSQNWGHFAPDSWAMSDKTGRMHEIMLSGESLARGAEDTFATVMHEATHAKAHKLGIKDTSRVGRYHNTRFKALAEDLGLAVVQDVRNGWCRTSLSKETKRRYSKEITAIRQALKAYRVGYVKTTTPRGKRTQLLQTKSGRTLRVPLHFLEGGGIFDEVTGEKFLPVQT